MQRIISLLMPSYYKNTAWIPFVLGIFGSMFLTLTLVGLGKLHTPATQNSVIIYISLGLAFILAGFKKSLKKYD